MSGTYGTYVWWEYLLEKIWYKVGHEIYHTNKVDVRHMVKKG